MLLRRVLLRKGTRPTALVAITLALFLFPLGVSMTFGTYSRDMVQEITIPYDMMFYGELSSGGEIPAGRDFTHNFTYYRTAVATTPDNRTEEVVLVITDTVEPGKFRATSELAALTTESGGENVTLKSGGGVMQWQLTVILLGESLWKGRQPLFVSTSDFNTTGLPFIALYAYSKKLTDTKTYLSDTDRLQGIYERRLEDGEIRQFTAVPVRLNAILDLSESLKQIFMVAFVLNVSLTLLLLPTYHAELLNWRDRVLRKTEPLRKRGVTQLNWTLTTAMGIVTGTSILTVQFVMSAQSLLQDYRILTIATLTVSTGLVFWTFVTTLNSRSSELPYNKIIASVIFVSGILLFTTFENQKIGVVSLLTSVIFYLIPVVDKWISRRVIRSKDFVRSVLCRQYFALPKKSRSLLITFMLILLTLSVVEGTLYSSVRTKQIEIGGDVLIIGDSKPSENFMEIRSGVFHGTQLIEVMVINTTQLEQITKGHEWTSEADEFIASPLYDKFVKGELTLRNMDEEEVQTPMEQVKNPYTIPGIKLVPKINKEKYLIASTEGAKKLNLTELITLGYVVNGVKSGTYVNTGSRYMIDILWKQGGIEVSLIRYALSLMISVILFSAVFEVRHFRDIAHQFRRTRGKYISRGMKFDKNLPHVLLRIQIATIIQLLVIATAFVSSLQLTSELSGGTVAIHWITALLPMTLSIPTFAIFSKSGERSIQM